MNTKEAMEKIEYWLIYYLDDINERNISQQAITKIEEEFQQGEKYREMWYKLKKDLANVSVNNWEVSTEKIIKEMEKQKQEYFPESKKGKVIEND